MRSFRSIREKLQYCINALIYWQCIITIESVILKSLRLISYYIILLFRLSKRRFDYDSENKRWRRRPRCTDYVYDDENGLDDVGGEVQCVTFISKNLLVVPTLPCEPEVAVGRCIRAASEMKL